MSDLQESLTEYSLRISKKIEKQVCLIQGIETDISYLKKMIEENSGLLYFSAKGNNVSSNITSPTKKVIANMVLVDLQNRLRVEKYKLQCMIGK